MCEKENRLNLDSECFFLTKIKFKKNEQKKVDWPR